MKNDSPSPLRLFGFGLRGGRAHTAGIEDFGLRVQGLGCREMLNPKQLAEEEEAARMVHPPP